MSKHSGPTRGGDPDYIEVTVRVPADLEVKHDGDSCKLWVRSNPRDAEWFTPSAEGFGHKVYQQIAAAVEARKPTPPKFQVGDVVEWQWESLSDGITYAGAIREVMGYPGGYVYWLHGFVNKVSDNNPTLKLVRRAEK